MCSTLHHRGTRCTSVTLCGWDFPTAAGPRAFVGAGLPARPPSEALRPCRHKNTLLHEAQILLRDKFISAVERKKATGMFLAHVTSFSSTNYYYELEATGMFLLILLKPCENSLVDKYICPFLLKRSASAAFCDMFPFLLRATHSELCQHASLAAS